MPHCKSEGRLGLILTSMCLSFFAACLCWTVCGVFFCNVFSKLSHQDRTQTLTVLQSMVLILISLERTLRTVSTFLLFYGPSLIALAFGNCVRLLIPTWVFIAMYTLSLRLSLAFAGSLYSVDPSTLNRQKICLIISLGSLTFGAGCVILLDFTGDEIFRIGTLVTASVTMCAVCTHLIMVNHGFSSRLKSLVAAQSVHTSHAIMTVPPIVSPNRSSVTGTHTGRPSVSEMSTTHTATGTSIGIRQALTFSSVLGRTSDPYTSTSVTDGVMGLSGGMSTHQESNTHTDPNPVGRHRSRGSSIWSEFRKTKLDEFDDSQVLLLKKAAKSTVISVWLTLASFLCFISFLFSRFTRCISALALAANVLLGCSGMIAALCTLLSTSQASQDYDRCCSLCNRMVLKLCGCLTNREIDENVFAGASPISPHFSINFRVDTPEPTLKSPR